MTYSIVEAKTRKQIMDFIKMPFKLYEDDPNWVAPLTMIMKKTLLGPNNPLFANGVHVLLLLKEGSKTVGRIVTGIDEKVNEEKNTKRGYIALFECIEDRQAAFMLLDASKKWLKDRGMTFIEGPCSPTNGDDYKGLLVEGFNMPPSLMCSYNPKYYVDYFEEYGFVFEKDLFAFYFESKAFPLDRFEKVVAYSQKKYNFRVDTVDKKKLDREIRDIHTILEKAVPESWVHFSIPSIEDIRKEANALLPFIDEDFVYIARSNIDDAPLGVVVGCPNFNEVFQKMNGNIFPFGVFKFLYYKNKIKSLRMFVQFVVPEY
ncbi:MAG: N-acetyltransferase, partial [Clostridia bacterium]|nr:N-acetyltransferase [Clostridia bacterium]